jgi:hypothetical protein
MLKNTNEITNNTTDKSDFLSQKELLENCANSQIFNLIIKELDAIGYYSLIKRFSNHVDSVHSIH